MTIAVDSKLAIRGRLEIPAWGAWWLEVEFDSELALTGRVSVAFEDLTLSGTVVAGGAAHGRARYRIVGGAGGWSTEVPARAYQDGLGVKTSKILADVATAVGETVVDAPTTRLTPAWVRERAPASRVLEVLFPQGWYVNDAGETVIGSRPATTYADSAAVERIDRAAGVVSLAPTTLAGLVPGATVEGVEVVDVLHESSVDGLRTTLWGADASATSRFLSAQRRLIESLFPTLRYAGLWEFRVVQQSGELVNLQAVRASSRLPDLQRVPLRPGVAGARADLTPGARVLVAFVDSSPGRPVVVAHEAAGEEAFAPSRLDLVGEDDLLPTVLGSVGRVVRYGDPIVFGAPGNGSIVAPPVGPHLLSRVRA